MLDYIVPLLIFACCAVALGKRKNAYDLMLQGAGDGLKLLISILPTLVLLLTAVTMLRASGAMELLTRWLSPVFRFVGIPPETAMLVLIRPISGSAAMAVAADLMVTYGVDSQIGRTAAVMLGSTETTFYTLMVYFSKTKVKYVKRVIPAAIFGDILGFFLSILVCRIFF